MPIKGGYDVQIDTYKFILDTSITATSQYRRAYDHGYIPVQASYGGSIAGERTLQDAKYAGSIDRMLWSQTDWVSGEGNRIYDPQKPEKYDYSDGLNPRIRGQLTGRPLRDSTTVTSDDRQQRVYMAVAQGILWVAGGQTVRYSTDHGANFTDASGGFAFAGTYRVSALAGNSDGLYVCIKNATPNHRIARVSYAAGPVITVTDLLTAEAGQPFIAAGILNGKLYTWTGRKLYEYDLTGSFPLVLNKSYRKVFDSGSDVDYNNYGGSSPGSWWGEIALSENSVFFMFGMEGQTWVYEYDGKAGTEIWHVPFGLTAKSMKVQNGIIFLAGHWGGESSADGFGAMYALPLDTRVPTFVCWFRKSRNQNFQMQEMANSYGSQILVAGAIKGKIWVYDADYNAISLLDDVANNSNEKLGDMLTFGKYRLAAKYTPGSAGTNYTLYRWLSDEESDRESVGTLSNVLESGEYDFNFPMEVKTLMGFHVTFKTLSANQRITISYSWDAASYTNLTAITSATSGASTCRVFLPVATGANDPKGYRLRVKITLDNNSTSGVQQPILLGCMAEVRVLNYIDVWDMFIRLKDEHQHRGRPTDRALNAGQVRDFLWTAARNKKIITFLDGAMYSDKPDHYATYTAYIDEIHDFIQAGGSDRSSEGTFQVRIVAIPT